MISLAVRYREKKVNGINTNHGFRDPSGLRDSEVGYFWIFVLESKGMNEHNHFPAVSTKNTVFPSHGYDVETLESGRLLY
jgi:hypothetical protein